MYYLLARYCDLIQRAEWGISYPWYYPFQKSFWRSLCRNRDHRDTNGNYDGYSSSGFSFSRVFKQFKRSKCCSFKGEYDLVIDNLSFDAPQDQITILLGHNGAGKSTVMKILSGIYDIDSGEVFVGGLSTETNLGLIRESLGLCPQSGISEHQTNLFSTYSVFVTARKSQIKHDILIAEMTVREQFQFFQRIKGLSQSEADEELINLADHCMLTQVNGSLNRLDRSNNPNETETHFSSEIGCKNVSSIWWNEAQTFPRNSAFRKFKVLDIG